MHTYTPANSISDGPITNLLSILCILVEVFSRAHAGDGGGGGLGGGGIMISSSALLYFYTFSE